MPSLLVAQTWHDHRNHQTLGHVWPGRFRSPPVQDDAHLWTVLRHIEANLLRARMITDPADYLWSSAATHASGRLDPLLSELR